MSTLAATDRAIVDQAVARYAPAAPVALVAPETLAAPLVRARPTPKPRVICPWCGRGFRGHAPACPHCIDLEAIYQEVLA